MDLPVLDVNDSKAFDKLIRTISLERVIALPRPDLPFLLDTDASEYQVQHLC